MKKKILNGATFRFNANQNLLVYDPQNNQLQFASGEFRGQWYADVVFIEDNGVKITTFRCTSYYLPHSINFSKW